jgi:hypothetical protein
VCSVQCAAHDMIVKSYMLGMYRMEIYLQAQKLPGSHPVDAMPPS